MNNNQIENSNSINKTESKSGKTIDNRADEILALLDIDLLVPDELIEKVIVAKESISLKEYSRFDFSKYLQIAAVFAAAVCIGIIMGKHADITSFNKKQNRKEQALIELREKHHLSDINSFGRL